MKFYSDNAEVKDLVKNVNTLQFDNPMSDEMIQKARAVLTLKHLTPERKVELLTTETHIQHRYDPKHTFAHLIAEQNDPALLRDAIDGLSKEQKIKIFNIRQERGDHNDVWRTIAEKNNSELLAIALEGLSSAEKVEVLLSSYSDRPTVWSEIKYHVNPELEAVALEGISKFGLLRVHGNKGKMDKTTKNGDNLSVYLGSNGERLVTRESKDGTTVSTQSSASGIYEQKMVRSARSWELKTAPTETEPGNLIQR